jgi:mRNA interferase MazF
VSLQDGARINGVVLADQIKSLDWKRRRASKVSRVTPEVMGEVTARVLMLVDPE